jgi:hypothetical protein
VRALRAAHQAHPDKPILALEFGRWADDESGRQEQARIFRETYDQLLLRSAGRGGYVGASVWWTLEDFTTMVPGIAVEHFGLYGPTGRQRPAGVVAEQLFEATSGEGAVQGIESDAVRAEVAREARAPDLRLVGYLAYGLAVSFAMLGGLLLVLLRRGGRAAPR